MFSFSASQFGSTSVTSSHIVFLPYPSVYLRCWLRKCSHSTVWQYSSSLSRITMILAYVHSPLCSATLERSAECVLMLQMKRLNMHTQNQPHIESTAHKLSLQAYLLHCSDLFLLSQKCFVCMHVCVYSI